MSESNSSGEGGSVWPPPISLPEVSGAEEAQLFDEVAALQRRATAAIVVNWITIFYQVLLLIVSVMIVVSVSNDRARFRSVYLVYHWTLLIQYPFLIALAVVAFRWTFLAYKNIQRIHGGSIRLSPSYATVMLLVPGINLFRSYRLICTLYRFSYTTPSLGPNPIIAVWMYIAYVFSFIFVIAANGLLRDIHSWKGILNHFEAIAFLHVTNIAVGVISLVIIRQITLLQEKSANEIFQRQDA